MRLKLKRHLTFFFGVFAWAYIHAQRVNFNDSWKFSLLADSSAYKTDCDDSKWRTIDLPHDWSIESDFSSTFPSSPGSGALPGGMGWYRKTFRLNKSEEKNYYIDFDGVYWNSRVWINGHLLGFRPNGYIAFRYDLTPFLNPSGDNVIAVQVDNTLQPNSRWYTGSGIYRNVWLVTTNLLQFTHQGTVITTPDVSEQKAVIKMEVALENKNLANEQFQLQSIILDKAGKKVGEANTPVSLFAGKSATCTQTISIDAPLFWSDENPYLYQVINTIVKNGKTLGKQTSALGVRTFSFDAANGFFLNGRSVKIKGVCMHHDLGCLGSAVNIRAIRRQLEILKGMGCNAIRTSHNPPAPELLDLCDQMGFLVMDEAFDIWRKKKSPHDYSRFFNEWHERDLTDWIRRDRNHPSVIMWSIGNEVLEQWADINADTLNLQQANMILNFANTLSKSNLDTTTLHVNSLLATKLATLVKQVDPTRPVTSGNNETEPSNYIFRSGAMDIIGFNYHEYNWGETFFQKFPGKSLIITESTSALMSRGYYDMPSDSIRLWPKRWDIPFDMPIHQCSAYDNCHAPWGSTHEASWNLVKKNKHISGLFLWTGFDYLGEPTPFWWPSRSSYFGVVDLAGFPKDVYYMYQSEWTDKPVLHLFPHWNWEPGKIVDVWAYYNQADEVELFLNGKSLGRKHKEGDAIHVMWRVPYEAGTLKAISYKNGKKVLSQEICTAGKPAAIRLLADRRTLTADGKDLSFVTVELIDKKGIAIPDASDLIRFSIEGNGFIAGTDNGNATDSVSLKKSERHLFNGKALVVVQTGKSSGKIYLKASAEGLQNAQLILESKKN
ncbi:MAG: glycoside hydrolase family 2 TIM barrel-domain containing protein [Dysgonamonadaceae bacterium]